LERVSLPRKVRLTGVSVHAIESGSSQLKLFGSGQPRSEKLNAALDLIAEKFGKAAVLPADLIGDQGREDEPRQATGAPRLDAEACGFDRSRRRS